MPANDLDLLIHVAREAGEVARGYVGGDLQVTDKPGGAGPVTAADLAVNTRLEALLRPARPDYGWLSEESTDGADRLRAPRTFVIDPIDGTRSFIEGSRTWAHAIAVVEAGEVVAGVVYLPLRGLLYAAARGGGAQLNGRPIAVSQAASPEGAEILATRPNMAPEHWRDGQVPSLRRSHRPSLAYRLCLVAEGRFDAMFTFRPSWEWDIAAGTLIVAEAGGRVTDRRGQPLRFNNQTPKTDGVVAGPGALQAELLNAMAFAGG